MTLTGLLVFAATYFLAVASPGPGTMSVVARVLSRGMGGLPAYITGFVLGDLIWFTIAATGLAVVAQAFVGAMIVVRLAGAAYLAWMAYQFWIAPVSVAAPALAKMHSTLAGLTLTLGNPKVIVFFLALLPSLADLSALTVAGFVELAALIAVILAVVLTGHGLAAARARRLFATPRAMRRLNRGSGVVMAGAAIAVVTR